LSKILDDLYKSPQLGRIKEYCKTLWSKGGEVWHPEITLHGPDHSEAVYIKLDKLTNEFMKTQDKLNPEEIFILLASVWLHDIGMLIKKAPNEDPEITRQTHHIRTYEFLQEKDNLAALGLNHVQARYISLVCLGHREIDLYTDTRYTSGQIGDSRIRTGFLTALLRLGDALDLDFKRAPDPLRKILENNLPPYSLLHWLKHHLVEGVDFSFEQPFGGSKELVIKIRAQKPERRESQFQYEYAIQELVMKQLRITLSDIELILLRNGMTPITRFDLTWSTVKNLEKELDRPLSSIVKKLITPLEGGK
jgi:hypothetical protein